MALAAQDYGARFFTNDAKPTGGWIEFPGTFKDPESKRVFRESDQAAQSGSNRGKVLVLENGMKFHEVGVTNKDAQFLELRKFQITDIARLFRVPPHMIADLDRATFSNIEQQSLEFVMHTMTPWAERWEASIESDLLPDGDALEIEFDFANLMRGDAASRSAYYQSGIQNGWLTRNEARISENLNPIAGLDQPLRPLNMVEEDDAEDAEIESQRFRAPMPVAEPDRAVEPAPSNAGRVQRPAIGPAYLQRGALGSQNEIEPDRPRPSACLHRHVQDWAQGASSLEDEPALSRSSSLTFTRNTHMNRQLLLSEFLTTPWALMPERLQAMAGVLTRWSAGEPPTDETMFQIQSERVLRDTRKQMAAANAGSGIAVLPLYGVVTQRGNMVDDISGPGSTSTQQFTSASAPGPGRRHGGPDPDRHRQPWRQRLWRGRTGLGDRQGPGPESPWWPWPTAWLPRRLTGLAALPVSSTSPLVVRWAPLACGRRTLTIPKRWKRTASKPPWSRLASSRSRATPMCRWTQRPRPSCSPVWTTTTTPSSRLWPLAEVSSVDDVRNGMGEGRVLGADAALAQRMVDGIASFDDVLARMQAKVTGNAVRSQPQKSQSRLKQARDALATGLMLV
jgi:hypothetical protein